MTPIRRLLNIVQFDLAEKLNLARLRWYHLNHQDQYLQSVIYGNPDNCTLFRLREVQTEISTLTPELQGQFMDLVVEYMEESINWPDPDNQETFEKQLLG